MFDPTSRYYDLEVATLDAPGGRTVAYVRRRFLPRGEQLPLLAEVAVQQGERVDLLAHRTLGDGQAYWRICDANNAIDPSQLTSEPGRMLRVPLPRGTDR